MTKIYDERGWFLPLPNNINVSFSKKNVFRGMHAQTNKPQGKNLILLSGNIVDVFINEKGEIGCVEMHDGDTLHIPPGYYHGFYAKEDSMLLYVCSEAYNPESEIGIHWEYVKSFLPKNVKNPILSAKDSQWRRSFPKPI